MTQYFSKIIFFWKRPGIIVADDIKVGNFLEKILKNLISFLQIKDKSLSASDILRYSQLMVDPHDKDLNFLIKSSRKAILCLTGENPELRNMINILPKSSRLVLNFDFTETRSLGKDIDSSLTFGFFEGADVKATDINRGEDSINFKLNYRGSFVPIWLKNLQGKNTKENAEREIIYPILAACAISIILGMHLVEISQALKEI